MYSTPAKYVKYLNREKGVKWEVRKGDFFPYASAPHHFWTGMHYSPHTLLLVFYAGYFSSRPGLKGYARTCNAHLQACKQLEAIHNGMGNNGLSSVKLRMDLLYFKSYMLYHFVHRTSYRSSSTS